MTDRQALVHSVKAAANLTRGLPKDIPFNVFVEAFSGFSILPLDALDPLDLDLLTKLETAARQCAAALALNPIVHSRANDVGELIETPLKAAIAQSGLRVEKPLSATGKPRRTGYPDLLVRDEAGRPTYVECKTYAAKGLKDRRRAFYVPPSDRLKVAMDARHLLIGFEMMSQPDPQTPGSRRYWPVAARVVDCFELKCVVKFEVQSSNPKIYAATGPGFSVRFD